MKLTVLIPVYNTKPDNLLEAVYSILRQDDKTQHDIILANDGSDDTNTLLMLDYLNTLLGVTILNLSKNSGTSVALNEGHKLVKTEYVAIMGSDDISSLSRFSKQIAYLEANKEVDILGTNLFGFYDNDIFRKQIFRSHHAENPDLTRQWFVNHGTVIYKQKVVEEMNGYNPDYKRGQDVELWGRIRNNGSYIFANIPEILYAWRRYKK